MTLFGFEIKRRAPVESLNLKTTLQQPLSSAGCWVGGIWWPRESYTGAWQSNVVPDKPACLLAYSAVFACVTGIAQDISKMRIKLDRITDAGIWEEVTEGQPAFLPVLRKPNSYQNRIKFLEQWVVSLLLWGNAYILKEFDNRNVVRALYVLDPCRVVPLVADDGSVYYEIRNDYLSQVRETVVVPADQIIHDMMPALWHPLVGVSPIYACGMSATMGTRIQNHSTQFFANLSRPGGMLTAPGKISDDTAKRLKDQFESNFGGANIGRLFVAGDGLEFAQFTMPAEDSQLIEQLRWTVEDVARAFHYPMWRLDPTKIPPYSTNPEILLTNYYAETLQARIESIELCLDEALGLPALGMGTELDLDALVRMDTQSLFEANNKAVGGGWMKPDEARNRANLPPVTGGNTPYMQQQNYSLAALARRDAQADPFGSAGTPAPAALPSGNGSRALEAGEPEDIYNNEDFLAALRQ